MIICNITMQVGWKIHNEWLQWMKELYIPSVMESGSFKKYQWSRLKELEETDGPTYCIQYYAENNSALQNYLDHYAIAHAEKLHERWGTDCLSFRTIMEVIH